MSGRSAARRGFNAHTEFPAVKFIMDFFLVAQANNKPPMSTMVEVSDSTYKESICINLDEIFCLPG
jgi:hypothetical protein